MSKLFRCSSSATTASLLLVSLLWSTEARADWYDGNWLNSKTITINGGLCGATPCIAAGQTDFPVLISLPSDSDLAARAQNDGDDILFTAADGVTKLDHEIEFFDGGSGALVAWVRIPSLPAGVNSTIFLYYGNTVATSQQNKAGVWGASYRAVWHLPEDPSLSQMMDSTSNANHGVSLGGMTTSDQVPGQIAGSLNFDGTDDGINAGSDSTLDDLGPMTISAWVWPNHVPGTSGKIVGKVDSASPDGRYFLELDDTLPEDDAFEFTKSHATTDLKVDSINSTVSYTAWQHVTLTWDGSSSANNVHIYRNGIEVAYQQATSGVGAMGSDAGASFFIGCRDNGTELFSGLIDEVRIASIEWPLSRIQTEYNNHVNQGVGPGRFILSLGAEVTAVELVSFDATGFSGSVALTWETGSELDNLGFHLYRSVCAQGPYERLTTLPIPGLGSSPVGAKYRYVDSNLTNGVTYYYELEDIETTGKTQRHGPVSAAPNEDAPSMAGDDVSSSRVTYGDPATGNFRVLRSGSNELVLELETGGFYAELQDDGTVTFEVPDYVSTSEAGRPSLPVRRSWVEALAGRKVELVSAEIFDEEVLEGLTPSFPGPPKIEATRRTVRIKRSRRKQRTSLGRGFYPLEPARLMEVGYQGDVKKVLVEMAPFRWDGRRLVLARRMVVRLSLRGRDPQDRRISSGKRYSRNRNLRALEAQSVAARLVTRKSGLYAVGLKEVFGRARRRLRIEPIRLSRQGVAVPFHREGAKVYFLSEGPEANPYGNEAVYELEVGVRGSQMVTRDASPSGDPLTHYLQSLEKEENLLYYPTLLEAPDRWLWKALFAPARESFVFMVSALSADREGSRLEVWLQGASDFPETLDHHVRVRVNGSFVGEILWDGENPQRLDVELLPGVLREGDNVVEIENVGDTDADYSMVLLDRFHVTYPRFPQTLAGYLEGVWPETGNAEVSGINAGSIALDTTGDPIWLERIQSTRDTLGFHSEAGRRYLVVGPEAILSPEIRKPLPSGLKTEDNEADWLAIGPSEFLDTLKPLLTLRRNEGLRVKSVGMEEVYSEFGFGETNPRALRDFLAFAYMHWKIPPRYVVLAGDATYDFKDRLGTGVVNRVPPLLIETSYLETVSDPALAMVNGNDSLPDLAVGRLPAADIWELKKMVEKIITFETSDRSHDDRVVLVADDPDGAGNFEADAVELSTTVLSTKDVRLIFVGAADSDATGDTIQAAFNDGASLMSYIGHGGIHLWADENVLNIGDVANLAPQLEQPILFTMSCLNGYFHFPYFNALSEELLKADGKGVLAAVSPSGMSLNDAAHLYHQVLLEEITIGRHSRLGDAILAGQVRYAETGLFPEALLIYHLLGDPALSLR